MVWRTLAATRREQRLSAVILWLVSLASSPLFVGFANARQTNQAQTNRGPEPAFLTQARAALAAGNPEKAIEILSLHLKANPADVAARVTLAQAFAAAGQSDRAEESFREVLRRSPNNFIALAALGELYQRSGDLATSEAMLARAVKADPSIPQIKMEWAVVLAQLHRYAEAHRALTGVSAPEDRQDRITFFRLKASIALGSGNPSEAASAMEKALAVSPDDAHLTLATAAAQLQSKHWERAVALAEPIFSQDRDPSAGLIVLEATLALNRDFRETLQELRQTTLPSTDLLAFRQRIAEVLIARGRVADAIEDLKVIADLEPARGDLLFNLALAQFRAGKVDDAFASAQKSKKLSDTADVEDLLGDIEEAQGDSLSAVHNYQSAVVLAPNEEKYRLSLAVELIRHKNFDGANAVLKQAADLSPKSWRVQLALGMVEHFSGTDQQASRILMQAADLAPRPEVALKYLGDIQMDQSSPPDPAALSRLCKYSDSHPQDGNFKLYCGAIMFRRDYASGAKDDAAEILRLLRAASALLPNDAAPHCQLTQVLRWMEDWRSALSESESCVRLDPNSAEAHYRLAQLYQHFSRPEEAHREMQLYEGAAKHVANENARREEALRTFLLTIQKGTPDQN